MPSVLNPVLYRRLERQFGPVKVLAEREAMIHSVQEAIGQDRYVAISHAGEYYQVNCPFCGDTRQRLYVNHMFGQTDKSGRRMLFLAICYNESCLSNPDNKSQFLDWIDDFAVRDADILQGVIVPEEARTVAWPGDCVSIANLKDNHPARLYVRERLFDPDVLAYYYDIRYCTDSYYTSANNRLIIPVFDKGMLKGWQARYVGELDWKGPDRKSLPPKYFSTPMSDFRSKCLYNWENCKEWETGIIVEGPTDVWRFGLMATCVFGNTMTLRQRDRFRSKFKNRTAVLLLDPEEFESKTTLKLMAFFNDAMPGQVACVKLPEGEDPGSLERDYLREYVKYEAAQQGVKVRYRKVRDDGQKRKARRPLADR